MTSDEWEILSFLYNFFTFGILHRSCRIFFIALKYVRIFFEYIFSIYFIVCNDFFLFNLLHGYSYILSFNGIFSSWMLPHCLSLHGQNSHQQHIAYDMNENNTYVDVTNASEKVRTCRREWMMQVTPNLTSYRAKSIDCMLRLHYLFYFLSNKQKNNASFGCNRGMYCPIHQI